MDHIAVISKNWIEKILSGEKKIESRWYKHKKAPWGRIKRGDKVYFKESGKKVSLVCDVKRVLFFEDLNIDIMTEIINKYGRDIGIDITYVRDCDKRYCILIFIENVRKIEPFNIVKKGYGNMAAWISIEDVNYIKR